MFLTCSTVGGRFCYIRHSESGLVPRPLPFLSSVEIHGSKRAVKMGKAWSHSSCEWMRGGLGGSDQYLCICVHTKFESNCFLPVKMSSFDHANV